MIKEKKITLEGIDMTMPVDIITEDGVGLIRHDILENFITKNPRITVDYKLLHMNPEQKIIIVQCTMTDIQTNRSVTKIGETNENTLTSEVSRNFPATIAYQRAYNRAGIAILGLNEGGHIYSDVEVSRKELEKNGRNIIPAKAPESAPVSSPPSAVLTDDTVLLIGGSKGKKFGEVKNTKKFQSFMEWCKSPNTVVTFQGEAEKLQFEAIKNL